MRLCSDDSTSNKIVLYAEGSKEPGEGFTIKLDDGTDQIIDLDYHLKSWKIFEKIFPGDLAGAQTVQLQYKAYNILCLERLELETLDGSKHFKILQVSYKHVMI